MPIELKWTDDEQTIQLMDVSEPWTWDDLAQATSRSAEMAGKITHDYYFIVDFSKVKRLPRGAFTNLTRLNATKPEGKDTLLIAVVGVSGMLRSTTDMFARVFGRNVVTFDKRQQAFEAINEHKQKAEQKV